MRSIFSDIADLINRRESFAVCTVMEKTGSVPRAEGAKMIVRADGSSIGTVGGGRVEAETAALAGEVIPRHAAAVFPFRMTGEDAATSDMICGGSGRILIDFIDSLSEDERQVFTEAAAVVERGGRAWLVTDLSGLDLEAGAAWRNRSGAGPAPAHGSRHCLVHADGRRIGRMECPPGVGAALLTGPARNAYLPLVMDDGRFLAEPLRRRGTVFLFGAGHVAQKIAPLCASVGFVTQVFDDRPALLDRARFPDPIELSVIGSFQELPPLQLDEDSYVVIATRGHLHDRGVLMQALRSPAGYIGMMGSRRKKDMLFSDLLEHGFAENELGRIRTPIGLAIGAQTPEEIAVAVVAELIAVRAEREGNGMTATRGTDGSGEPAGAPRP